MTFLQINLAFDLKKLITLYQCDFQTKNIKGEKMEESIGLGKKSSGPETDTETWSWFRLPIPKPGLGCTLQTSDEMK